VVQRSQHLSSFFYGIEKNSCDNCSLFLKWLEPSQGVSLHISQNMVYLHWPDLLLTMSKFMSYFEWKYQYLHRNFSKPNLEFIDVSTGYPSSIHDSSVYVYSTLSQNLTRLLAGTRYVLLADSAYGLPIRIMKPYRNNGGLSDVSYFVIVFSSQ
jgi:hypothetical protein